MGEEDNVTKTKPDAEGDERKGLRRSSSRRIRRTDRSYRRRNQRRRKEPDNEAQQLLHEETEESASGAGEEDKGAGMKGIGRPIRPGFVWEVGAHLEAKDFMDHWYSAKIIGINDRDGTVKIHFDGWNQRYDESVDMNSDRLRPITRHSDRKKSQPSKPLYKVGDGVYARWTDCRMYPAKIVAVSANGSYEVRFNDGVKKTIKAINVDMKPPASSLGTGKKSAPEPSGRKLICPSPETPAAVSETVRKRRSTSVAEEDSIVADDVQATDDNQPETHLNRSDDSVTDASAIKRRLIHVKTPVHGKTKKRSTSPPAATVDSKQEDTQLKCPHENCSKSFRNSTLLQYHIKYYHPDDNIEISASLPQKSASATSHSRRKTVASSTDSGSETAERRKRASIADDLQSMCFGDDDDTTRESTPTETTPVSVAAPVSLLVSRPQLSAGSRFIARARTARNWRRKVRGRRGTRRLRSRRRQKINQRTDVVVTNKVVNCVCRDHEETSELIQCTVCLCWQHLQCIRDNTPDVLMPCHSSYMCPVCTNPPGLRDNARYSFSRDWLVDGQLAEYDEALIGTSTVKSYGSAGKAKIMKVTHELVGDLHNVQRVINSVNCRLFTVQEQIGPQSNNGADVTGENGSRKEQRPPVVVALQNGKRPVETGRAVTGRHVQANERSGSAVTSEAGSQLRDLPSASANGTSPDGVVGKQTTMPVRGNEDRNSEEILSNSCTGNGNSTGTAGESAGFTGDSLQNQDSAAHKRNCETTEHVDLMSDDGCRSLNSRSGDADKIANVMSDELPATVSGAMVNAACPSDHSTPAAQTNDSPDDSSLVHRQLLTYISQMQDNIEDSLEVIEAQVAALESGEGNGNPNDDILRDMPRVKKTLNQLVADLNVVDLMSFCR